MGLRRFLSTTRRAFGSHIDPGGVRGYYVDLRVKAPVPARRPDNGLPATVCQWGLGAYERHLAGEDGDWLAAAVSAGEWLLSEQGDGGGYPSQPMTHTFALEPPWLSALAQGQGASLLVRLHLETGRGEFAEAAKRAPAARGAQWRGRGPGGSTATQPPRSTRPTAAVSSLNGAIFALLRRDVGTGLGDDCRGGVPRRHARSPRASIAGTRATGPATTSISHPLTNVSSAAYHRLHSDQLRALNMLAPHPEFEETAARFERYRASRLNRACAFAAKRFRLRVPRR